MFELKTPTEAKMTSFTGRTQRHGDEDVPAVSFRLQFMQAPNSWLDKISPTLRPALYKSVEGQEQLPGVEPATPVLRSRDIKHIKLENVYEGWRVTIEHGIDDESALVMGSVKIDDIGVTLHEGGFCDFEVRFGTADLDRHGAGLLWSKQKEMVSVMAKAPAPKQAAIDGTTEAFKRDYSTDGLDQALQADLLDGDQKPAGDWPFGERPAAEANADAATDAFLGIHGDDEGGPPDSDQAGADGEGSDTDVDPIMQGARAFEAAVKDELAGRKSRRAKAGAH